MSHSNQSYRLLIVDDDETDRRLYGWLLARQASGNFDIQHAADGAAGIAALRSRKFDCMLLDFSLPDVTGLEFLNDAMVDGELPCAVVLITGHGNEAVAVEAMKLGVQDYLVKDHVNEGRLWRAIVRAISQRELRERLAVSMRALTASNATLEKEVAAHRATEAALRVAKEAAEQANRAKTRFVAMVTHELRTPLTGVLGYAELLRNEGGLSVRQNARVRAMIQAGRHLSEMIDGVLDFASIESGRISLQQRTMSVRDLVESCIACIRPVAAERGLSLRLICDDDAPRQIFSAPARLQQILLNLLGNAVKFTDAGRVELRVSAGKAGTLRIEVADTGPGIKEGSHDRLFQDFGRLDVSGPTEGVGSLEGAGLGLTIAARVVELLGGTIGHIPNPGGGSIFWLELPSEATSVSSLAHEAGAQSPPSGSTVLLVDDIGMNRDVIGAFLRAAGHEVELAENGQDAVRLASVRSYDLILMDVRMPEMDGLEATRQIRALLTPYGQVPIVALTAYFFPDQVTQCQEAGMDGHVAKPVNYATLVQAVARGIARCPPSWATGNGVSSRATAEDQPPPKLDRVVLDHLLAFLTPADATANLMTLRTCQECMLRLLDRPTDPSIDQPATRTALTDSARALASTAGMFGFTALSVVARRLECAPDDGELARQVSEETRAALAVLDTLMSESRMLPV